MKPKNQKVWALWSPNTLGYILDCIARDEGGCQDLAVKSYNEDWGILYGLGYSCIPVDIVPRKVKKGK